LAPQIVKPAQRSRQQWRFFGQLRRQLRGIRLRAAAKAHNNSLAENARLFALLNMITSDSQVACWCCKYKYNFLRPITAIHNADPLGNSAIKSDSNWESLLCTPAHPDYPAGHCAREWVGLIVGAGDRSAPDPILRLRLMPHSTRYRLKA
jgi:hypothetical protein